MEENIEKKLIKFLNDKYNLDINFLEIQPTNEQFKGDITIIIFPLFKFFKKQMDKVAAEIGNFLIKNFEEIISYNLVQGFLNLEIDDFYYVDFLKKDLNWKKYGFKDIHDSSETLIEFSSPNTNKPLHLGHIRNNLLGFSVARILEANGKKVHKTQIINDKGIHICKSMVAWKKFAKGETPSSKNIKGDFFVGKYYVLFDKHYKNEVLTLISSGVDPEKAKKQSKILNEAQSMLIQWEQGDIETKKLWSKMNNWVYKGFEKTYSDLGVSFDSIYYESDTYVSGKKIVEQGLKKKVFFQKKDKSIWVDLSKEGLDEKILLRSDGTSVYITQDIGTILARYKKHPKMNSMIYTVGNEQNYHFKVLFLILKKLGYNWSNNLHHLSYGMVDLPSGKMKSREGNVVDADELISEMIETAKEISENSGKLNDLAEVEKKELYKTIGLGALKYFILKVDPKKRILFDPKSSVDFNGNTGPFIQYTYARINSIFTKSRSKFSDFESNITLDTKEKHIIKKLMLFPFVIEQAGNQMNPSLIANYIYDLVKNFNSYYQSTTILVHNDSVRSLRLSICDKVGHIIKNSMGLLGIDVPERM